MQNKTVRKTVCLFLVITLCVIQLIVPQKATAFPLIHRIAGYTQYDTASDIAKVGWEQSDYAVLAYGENFPDALAAAPLAKKYNAPILLTESHSLTPITKQTLQDLKVKNVFIVGGTAVISQDVEDKTKDLGITVVRLAGFDRYDTAVEIAKQLGNVHDIFVVSGEDYADALSVSPIAAQRNAAIILVSRSNLSDSIKEYLSANKISNTYLTGDSDQISDSVANLFPNVERITGNDMYSRNIAVLNRFDSSLDLSKIFLATGNGYADALSGSAYAAGLTMPILLVDHDYNQNTGDYLKSKSSMIKQLNVLGGEAVMPSALVQKYIDSSSEGNQPGLSYTASEIAKKLSPSIVNIEVSDSAGIPIASGSGYILDPNGKIATSYQLLKGAYSAKVITNDGSTYSVTKVLAYDLAEDTALIQVDATELQAVTLGDSDKIATGDKIYTLGNSRGISTMTEGIVSTKNRVIDGGDFIQVSAQLSSEASGGVLVNEDAEVIGMMTKGVSDNDAFSYAVPVNLQTVMMVKDINVTLPELPSIINQTEAEFAKMSDQEFAEYLKTNYGEMIVDGKTIHFTDWKVNDYKTGLSDVSVHGIMASDDYANWKAIVNNDNRSAIFSFFVQIKNETAKNYPGKSYSGNVMYEEYYPYMASPQFPYNEVTYAGDGKWLVRHTIASFYDLYTMHISDSRVVIPDYVENTGR